MVVAFRLQIITVRGKYNGKALAKDLLRELKNAQQQVRRDLKATVETWEIKPKFSVKKGRDPETLEIFAGTDSELYRMLNDGTEAHRINPKVGTFLKFNFTGYTAKTTPNLLKSKAGGFIGTDTTFSSGVDHPGTEPRLWVETAAARVAKRLRTNLKVEMLVWARTENIKLRNRQKRRRLVGKLTGDDPI